MFPEIMITISGRARRETQYVETIRDIAPPARLPVVPHTTRNFFARDAGALVPAYFPTRLIRRHPHLRIKRAGPGSSRTGTVGRRTPTSG